MRRPVQVYGTKVPLPACARPGYGSRMHNLRGRWRLSAPFVLAGVIAASRAVVVAPVSAEETLAEAAARQKERPKGESQTFTNEDLAKDRPDAAVSSPASTADPAPGADADMDAPPANAPPRDYEAARQRWEERSRSRRAAFDDARSQVADAQAKLDMLVTPYRWPARLVDPIEVEKAEAYLTRAKAVLAAAEGAITQLRDEASQRRVPPGWVSALDEPTPGAAPQ
jgi:hypothetical protein